MDRNFEMREDTVAVTGQSGLEVFAPKPVTSEIKITGVSSNFEREMLIHPFGFKGGYLTELWQSVSRLESGSGVSKIGVSTQSVLYADPDVFSAHSEAGGNALMFTLTERSLQFAKGISFIDPIDLIEKIFPYVYEEGQRLTGKKNLNKMFALNALVGIDNAAWLLYSAENNLNDFDAMIPPVYKEALSNHNDKLAVMYMVSYGLPLEELKKAVQEGYFLIKIKIGQPGRQEEMLRKDIDRLTEIHNLLKDFRTDHTPDTRLIYTMDANARYEEKDTLLRLLDHAKKIGAFDRILLIEEPFSEANETHVGDVGIPIAADESAYDEASTSRRLDQGYGALVLKGIAKTLSLTMKMANLAYQRGIPCICSDLTGNPILVDWHKNLASRTALFPGMNMGVLEVNGDLNYSNWQTMLTYNPAAGASWAKANRGVFELGDDFYRHSGGIFHASPHYQALFEKD